jgi:hypothetical protein
MAEEAGASPDSLSVSNQMNTEVRCCLRNKSGELPDAYAAIINYTIFRAEQPGKITKFMVLLQYWSQAMAKG